MSLLAALVVPAPVQAAGPRVGVIVAVEVNLEPGEATRLSALIGEALAEKLEIDPVAGADVARRLPPGGVPDGCLGDRACLTELGARLVADQLLLIVAVKIGDRIQLDPTWADVASGRTVPRGSVEIGAALDGGGHNTLVTTATHLLPDAAARAAAPPPVVVVEPMAAPPPPVERDLTATYIAGGVAFGALGLGVGFGVAARTKEGDLQDSGCGEERACPGGADTVARRALIADVCYGAAAVAAIAAGVLYWRAGRATSEVAIGVAPSEDGAALGVAGRF